MLALGVGLGAWGAKWWAEREAKNASKPVASAQVANGPAKVTVEARAVQQVSMPRGVSAVGTLRSEDSVVLRPEITGRITEINFSEGGKVKKGQVLIRLDDSVAKAQLQQAQANLSLANSQYRRAIELGKQGFISKQARDESSSQLKVQQAAASLAQANLDKTVILAPFDGLIGLRNVSVGDYVSPGADLVPIESIDPLKVDFRIPEHYLGQVKEGSKLALSFDALPGQTREGEVGAISPQVEVGGRSILLRANVPNADDTLRPGMFARVRLQFSDELVTVVPETALVPAGEEQYVYRIDQGKAKRVVVKVGQRRGGTVEIQEGLNAGDQVIVSGLQKVRDGDLVEILPTSQPASS